MENSEATKQLVVCGYEKCSEVGEFDLGALQAGRQLLDPATALPKGWIMARMDGMEILFSSRECLDRLVEFRKRLNRKHLG